MAILVSALAGAACVITGVRAHGRLRRGWLLLGAGMVSWSIGESIWAYYEVFAGREVPFPSFADIGYLGMVPLALAGVAALITTQRHTLRAVLDGLIISGSILFLSWATVLGPMAGSRAGLAGVDGVTRLPNRRRGDRQRRVHPAQPGRTGSGVPRWS